MVGTFKAKNPVNTFLLFVYGFLLKFYFLSHSPRPSAGKTDGILYRELLLALQEVSVGLPFIYSVITYILLFTQAVSLNRILSDQRLIQPSSHLPAMSYMLITSIFPEWNMLNSTLIVNTLLIWIWSKINGLHNNQAPKTALFNIGIATGIAALLYFPALGFALLIAFALLLLRPFNPAEWAITLAGIITPFYYLFAWLFLSDNLRFYGLPVIAVNFPRLYQNYWVLAAIIIVVVGFIAGAYFARANVTKQVVQIRKSWDLIVFYLIIALLIPFINDTRSFTYWIVSAVPLSAFIACAFLYPPKIWFPRLLHWCIAALVVVISYFNK